MRRGPRKKQKEDKNQRTLTFTRSSHSQHSQDTKVTIRKYPDSLTFT